MAPVGPNDRGVYFGVVYVRSAPAPPQQTSAVSVSVLGGWADRGALGESTGVGWRSSKALVTNAECQLVVFVRDATAVEAVRAQIQVMVDQEEPLCVAPMPG